MPEDCLYPIDGMITFPQAVLAEPLSIAVYAVRQAAVSEGANVGILGAGPIGLCVLLVTRLQADKAIYMTEKVKERVEIAVKAGAAWVGNPNNQDIVKDILD